MDQDHNLLRQFEDDENIHYKTTIIEKELRVQVIILKDEGLANHVNRLTVRLKEQMCRGPKLT